MTGTPEPPERLRGHSANVCKQLAALDIDPASLDGLPIADQWHVDRNLLLLEQAEQAVLLGGGESALREYIAIQNRSREELKQIIQKRVA